MAPASFDSLLDPWSQEIWAAAGDAGAPATSPGFVIASVAGPAAGAADFGIPLVFPEAVPAHAPGTFGAPLTPIVDPDPASVPDHAGFGASDPVASPQPAMVIINGAEGYLL